jgi:hypothetical protein
LDAKILNYIACHANFTFSTDDILRLNQEFKGGNHNEKENYGGTYCYLHGGGVSAGNGRVGRLVGRVGRWIVLAGGPLGEQVLGRGAGCVPKRQRARQRYVD